MRVFGSGSIRTYQIPVMVGHHVTTLEFSVEPSLGLESSVDSRRVMIRQVNGYKTIELPIQAVEELARWWINHGPIPKEQRHVKE